jgi:two-component system, NtrC family, response regulator AtoC
MKKMSGLELLKRVRELDPACAVLMITAYGSQRIAVEAMKAGAEDYLPKPFDNDELRLKVRISMSAWPSSSKTPLSSSTTSDRV